MHISYNSQPQTVDDDQSMGEARAVKNVQNQYVRYYPPHNTNKKMRPNICYL